MKRFLVPVLAGFLAFSAVVASAATLGGLSSAALGSDDTIVAACDSDDVELTYETSYDPSAGSYVVGAATVSGIAAACAGQELSVTGTSETVTFADAVSAEALTAASVLITG